MTTKETLNKESDLLPIGTLLRHFYEDHNTTDAGTLYEVVSMVSGHRLATIFGEGSPSRWVEILEPIRINPVGRRNFLRSDEKPFITKDEIIQKMDNLIVLPAGFQLI